MLVGRRRARTVRQLDPDLSVPKARAPMAIHQGGALLSDNIRPPPRLRREPSDVSACEFAATGRGSGTCLGHVVEPSNASGAIDRRANAGDPVPIHAHDATDLYHLSVANGHDVREVPAAFSRPLPLVLWSTFVAVRIGSTGSMLSVGSVGSILSIGKCRLRCVRALVGLRRVNGSSQLALCIEVVR